MQPENRTALPFNLSLKSTSIMEAIHGLLHV